MDFSIEILSYYRGRIRNRVLITPGEVCCQRNVNVRRSSYTEHRRIITPEELERWESFLADFPLRNLREEYINHGVKDGKQVRFEIRVDDEVKRIFVSNFYIAELGDLVAIAVGMLPEDCIMYNRRTVRTGIPG